MSRHGDAVSRAATGIHIRRRFELFGEALARALHRLGVDARVGPVPGEYCEGEFSVNDGGRTKPALPRRVP